MCIRDRVVEIHCCLALVELSIVVQQLLISDPVHITYSQVRDELNEPFLRHHVLILSLIHILSVIPLLS